MGADPQAVDRLRDSLDRFLHEEGGRYLLLMDPSGTPLFARGPVPDTDPAVFASLASAHFGAARHLASSLGDPDLTALVQQGEGATMVLLRLGEDTILALGFDSGRVPATPGSLSLRALDRLEGVVAGALGRNQQEPKDAEVGNWADEAESHIDRVFGEGA